jgi:hypothetical protein
MRTIDAVPQDAVGRHVASDDCPCRPMPGHDLEEPSQPVRLHRHATWPRDQMPPPSADALLWRSRRHVDHE